MSFLKRIFGRGEPAGNLSEITLQGTGRFPLSVVGESRYQRDLETICGGRTEEGADLTKSARLILEDTNPYDRSAVRVEIDGRTVGYLSREDAKAYRRYLQRIRAGRAVGVCEARIRGGWRRGNEEGYFGVFLDFALYG